MNNVIRFNVVIVEIFPGGGESNTNSWVCDLYSLPTPSRDYMLTLLRSRNPTAIVGEGPTQPSDFEDALDEVPHVIAPCFINGIITLEHIE